MQAALALANGAGLECAPNPRVGCLLVDSSGRVIGRGHTQAVGGPHAEVMALRDAVSQGYKTQGATAYVTLEPCSHHGRTGPCCDALITAGIRRVVAACEDPNPLVKGKGFERLRAAGVMVEVGDGATDARETNLGFFSRMQRGRPWIRVKLASSLDGITALPDGTSQWITSPEARADGHLWRAKANAMLTGVGTVLADNPKMTVRTTGNMRQPLLAIVDSRLRTPTDAALFDSDRPVWIFTSGQTSRQGEKPSEYAADVIQCPDIGGAKVDLNQVVEHFAKRELNEVHVEAGAMLSGALFEAGLVDELLLYMAPQFLGSGRRLLDIPVMTRLPSRHQLVVKSLTSIGPDIRVHATAQ